MSYERLNHSNDFCYFKNRKWRYTREVLESWTEVSRIKQTYGFCTCYEYALVRADPSTDSILIEEEDFIDMAINAGFLFNGRLTKYKYTLARNEGMVYIDMNVGDLFKEYYPEVWRDTFEYDKTPRSGRMYYALLGYLFPEVKPSFNDRFKLAYELAIDEVFSNIDPYVPQTMEQVVETIPRSTSAGFVSVKLTNARHKKGDIMPQVISEYKKMYSRGSNNKSSENYIMFAMRGHLSSKLKKKTRPVWMQSAETIIAELRYANPLYKQLEKKYFRDRLIHGAGSMKRLRQYLSQHQNRDFTNSDISGWDAFRCVFLHRRFFSELKDKIIMDESEANFYDYINFRSNIYGKVIFPSGWVFSTNGGLKSGSGFTLVQNSLLNMILSITILRMMNVYDGPNDTSKILKLNWLGDDFSLITNGKFDLLKFGSMVLKYFGLVVKEEKCFVAGPNQDRKYLGYELKGGLLHKDLKDLWNGSLYTESYFKRDFQSITKSFTRLFSYLILGGINNYEYTEFFYLFLGKYGNWLDSVEFIFDDSQHRMLRVLKDIYDVKISKFNSDSFKRMSLLMSKYILLYDYELIQVNKFLDIL